MNHVRRADNKPLNIVGMLFIIQIVSKAASLLADDILIQGDSSNVKRNFKFFFAASRIAFARFSDNTGVAKTIDYEQSPFFLVPSIKTRETRK